MQPNSLLATPLTVLTFGALLTALPAQTAEPAQANASAAPGSHGSNQDDALGLPAFLLPVPAGTVDVGLDLDRLLKAVSEAAFWQRPDEAAVKAKEKFLTALRRSVSVLGQRKVDVGGYLLGKWPVKNGEFQVYVDEARAAKRRVRAPFHWWRFGREDDYNERLDAIRKAFPKEEKGALYYWEQHGHELPYRVTDAKGNSIADFPVTYVSYLDANAFAARLGMRLPTELELMRAMRGNGHNVWPTCGDDPKTDLYNEQLLGRLKILNTSDWVLKPVGTVAAAIGPFGHVDMFGQVWQFCGDLGYEPIHGMDAFATEWKRLQKDKLGKLLERAPEWRVDIAIAKGGSYLSAQEPVQLMLDQRAPIGTTDVLEALGFRLAKSLRPGYDYLYSMRRVGFSREGLAGAQDLDLDAQIGAELYTLAANGFPTKYETVSLAPLNWLGDDKRADLNRMLEDSQAEPIVVAALGLTMPLVGGAPAGLYSLLFRGEGLPRELVEAIKKGHKVVRAEEKAKKNEGDKKAEEPPGDEAKGDKQDPKKKDKDDWQAVITRYGLEKADLTAPEAADGRIGFVRINGVQIPVATDVFLVRNQEGAIVATIPTRRPTIGAPFASTLVIEPGTKAAKEHTVAKIRFGVPMTAKDARKVAGFELDVELDRPAPTADQPWRLPK